MKKYILTVLASGLFFFTFGQSSFPFEVKITGSGNGNIIFIPGLSCSGDVWNETAEHYKMNNKCYILTFHGFAGVKADSQTSFKNWETSIARYITENKISNPVIIGHSIGGGMAMLLAADYPELISKIVVVDALPCLGGVSNPSFKAETNPNCTMYIDQFQSMNKDQYYQMQKSSMPTLMADTVHLAEAIEWTVISDRKATAEIFCQFLNTDLREKIAAIKCPALVLLESPFNSIKPVVEEQFKNLKTAEFKYSNKALHFIMYDDTNWYLAQTDEFLN